MAMTEEEARKCWCPNARVMSVNKSGVPIENFPVHNRIGIPGVGDIGGAPAAALCISSACMFWRWDAGSSPRARAPQTLPSQRAALAELSTDPTEGYCGQAGPA